MPESNPHATGFDSPVFKIEDDHLNRWPLACEIFNVAVNGPANWSTRIGVYGEWGTGKTSVLKFVSSMAETDGHIVVWFDPWGYSSKADLWQAFVLKCCDTIENKLGGIAQAGDARRKSYFSKARDFLGKLTGAIPGDAGTVASGALNLLKEAFSFGPEDIRKLTGDLNGKRVLILIDDLDRTAAQLVPEILYALKEVLDIPGFSFVCGFDPTVVGKVLHDAHPGFEDGLQFLEKIIDYPMWLASPTCEGLKKIASSDAGQHCNFVPIQELLSAVSLLPQNPRSIRQFVRLLALFRNQVERYEVHELRWSVILAATCIKVCYPKLAQSLLGSQSFWNELSMTEFMAERSHEKDKVSAAISQHIQKCTGELNLELTSTEQSQLREGLQRILDNINAWTASNSFFISAQISLIELPQAVTQKEFNACFDRYHKGEPVTQLKDWIVEHAKNQRQRESDVANALILSALQYYCSELHKADDAFYKTKSGHHRKNAKILLKILEFLMLKVSNQLPSLRSLDWLPLAEVLKDLLSLANAVRPVHSELWPKTKVALIALVKEWNGDQLILENAVRSISPSRSGQFENGEALQSATLLNDLLEIKIAKIVAAGFSEPGFIERVSHQPDGMYEFKSQLLNPSSVLWSSMNRGIFSAFRNAKKNLAIRENSYSFLAWVNSTLRNTASYDAQIVVRLIGEKHIITAIWEAATCVPFSGRYAYRLRALVEEAAKLGTDLPIPPWWQSTIEETLALYKREAEIRKAT